VQALRAVPDHTLHAIMQKQAALWRDKRMDETLHEILYLPRAYITEWLSTHTKRLDLRSFQMPVSRLLTLIHAIPAKSNLRVLHLPCSSPDVDSSDESLCILNALREVVSSWRQLSVLGLHRLQLREQHIGALSAILHNVKDILTGLALSLRDWQFQVGDLNCSLKCKLQFFEGIAKLQKLRLLAIPQWQRFVQNEHVVLTPLRKFYELTVLVNSCPKAASEACAIVPGLQFSQVMTGIFK
jgi:hypothetical protein